MSWEDPEGRGRVWRNLEDRGTWGRHKEEAKEMKAGKQAEAKSSLVVFQR